MKPTKKPTCAKAGAPLSEPNEGRRVFFPSARVRVKTRAAFARLAKTRRKSLGRILDEIADQLGSSDLALSPTPLAVPGATSADSVLQKSRADTSEGATNA